MVRIKGLFITVGNEANDFHRRVSENIGKLQNDKQVVEVQYSTTCVNGELIYSAMIIGRRDEF